MKAKSPKLLIFLTIFIDLLGFGIVLPISGYIAVDYVKTGANVKLTADVNAKAGVIPVADLAAFPEAGTVTVGKGPESRETISYEALDLAAKTLGTNEKPVKRGRDRSPVAEHKAAEDTVELLSPNWPYLIGILSSAFSLCQMLFAPFWGGLSDRVGRRPILLLSLFGSTVSYAIFGLSQSYTMLLVGRIFAGICGANLAAAQAYIADITEEKDRTGGMALVGIAFGLGFTLGPAISGLAFVLGSKLSPGAPSQLYPGLAAAALCLINFLWAIKGLPESLPPEKRGKETARRKHAPIREVFAALGNPVLGPLVGIFFLATLGFSNFEVGFGLYIKGNRDAGLTQTVLNMLFVYIGIIMIIVQGGIVRRLVKVVPEAILVIAGVGLQAIGLGLLPLTPQLGWLLFTLPFIACGQAIGGPSMLGLVSKAAPPERQGQTMGVTQSAASLARILGPMFASIAIAQGGRIYGESTGLRWPFWTGSMIMLLAAWMAVIVRSRMIRRPLNQM